MILEKDLKPEQIFFTDESKVELGTFTHDYICLYPDIDNDKKYDLLNGPARKFEIQLQLQHE